MIEVIKKAMLASVGFAYQTREKAEELGKKFIEEAKLSEVEGKKLVDELVKKSTEARSSFEKLVKDTIDGALKKLDIPTREEVVALKKRIEELEEAARQK
jgi:polyhydroxyalkanoate synthesis regulator phasin